MKKILLMSIALVIFLGVAQIKADLLTGDMFVDMYGRALTGVTSNNGSTYYIAPFHVTNVTTGQEPFIAFCGDGANLMSGNFYNPEVGVNYGAYQLGEVGFYSDFQKQCLQNLFDYAYGTLFLGDGGWNIFHALSFQFAIWEI